MKALRFFLCAVLAFSVLSFGGVQVWGQSSIEISAAVLLMVWSLIVWRSESPSIIWPALNWPLCGFVAIALVQLLLRESVYPFLTGVELLKLVAYFILFFLITQAFRDARSISTLAWFLVLLCFAVSLFGIVQHFTSEQEIYWLPSLHASGDVFGPYVNRNHFAGFVELTLPTGLALLIYQGLGSELFPLLAVLTVVPVSAMVLSGSRAGIIGMALELVLLVTFATRRRALGARQALAVSAVAVLALALVAWVGAKQTIERFSTLQSHDVSMARRLSMARGALRVFASHPLLGTGIGTLISVYPRYESIYDGRVVDHVHNDYLELLADAGIVGGVCGLWFLYWLYRDARRHLWVEQSRFSMAVHTGAAAALCGLLFHSFFDFNLHIPSNALLFLVQARFLALPPWPSRTRHAKYPHSAKVPAVSRPAAISAPSARAGARFIRDSG